MNQSNHPIEQLFESISDYSYTSVELWKLKAVDKTADIGSTMVINFILVSVISLFIIMLSIGVAFLIGDLLGKIFYGFFLVSSFYFISAVVLYFIRIKWMKQPIRNSIIKRVLNN